MRLVGESVILSDELQEADPDIVSALANNREIKRMIGSHSFPYPYTKNDAIEFLSSSRSDGAPFIIDFMIIKEGVLTGFIGLSDINWVDRNAHLGYWIGKEYWNHGIATEATKLVLSFAKEELNLKRIYSKVLSFNLRSLRVLLKNGFVVEGYERSAFFQDDQFHDMFLLSRIF